jgi:hypothetical protein
MRSHGTETVLVAFSVMTMLIRILALISVLSTAVTPATVLADLADGGPNGVYNSFESGKTSRDAGTIRGEIQSVDYGTGLITVRTSRGPVQVSVLPSTSIYVHGQYATLADLRRGANVEISVSEVDGRLVAQIIHLK